MKRAAPKRGTTRLKRTPLKRKSKASVLRHKADRALQDHYRSLKLQCEVCGNPADIMHHFVPKSASAFLKFDERNLIPLCHRCHFAHHSKADPVIHAVIIGKRGWKWFEELTLDRRIVRQYTAKDYEDKIKFYGQT